MYPLGGDHLYAGIGPTNLIRTVLSRSGAHPNQMKQVKMILKAQEMYFESHNSAMHMYEDGMTNDGHTSNMGAQGTLLVGAPERDIKRNDRYLIHVRLRA